MSRNNINSISVSHCGVLMRREMDDWWLSSGFWQMQIDEPFAILLWSQLPSSSQKKQAQAANPSSQKST